MPRPHANWLIAWLSLCTLSAYPRPGAYLADGERLLSAPPRRAWQSHFAFDKTAAARSSFDIDSPALSAPSAGVAPSRAALALPGVLAWAVEHDYVPASPFQKGAQANPGFFITELGRERLLDTGEWERLLAAANPQRVSL
jgi:hypothetical protein